MRYIAKEDFDILNTVFLKGEEIFIGPEERVMDGQFDYARKVYDSDRKYLGRIRGSHFDDKYKYNIEVPAITTTYSKEINYDYIIVMTRENRENIATFVTKFIPSDVKSVIEDYAVVSEKEDWEIMVLYGAQHYYLQIEYKDLIKKLFGL